MLDDVFAGEERCVTADADVQLSCEVSALLRIKSSLHEVICIVRGACLLVPRDCRRLWHLRVHVAAAEL